ncbi:MAG: twin-arginine translocase TatA/TatE family subunit [Firmicutes bacterium]|jgi:sec-independent protein translocase protein TatA|nr:twin-arginine translocase TatA/TatE family subunit [Bacillota bacterium]
MLFGKIGWMEVVLILAIVLIIFGPGKLPGLSRSLGQAIRNYKDALGGKGDPKEEETKKA